jgi:glycine/D-amino acid oxidase-like deaminating enzyme
MRQAARSVRAEGHVVLSAHRVTGARGQMEQVQSSDHRAPALAGYSDQPNRSPWIAQLAPDGPPRPLDADTSTDVVIIGAGIAGVATAFFILRSMPKRVVLIERDRVGRGATGRNAGQLTTYFERPLYDIADEFGAEMAIEAQRAFDDAHDLLDLMAAEAGVNVRVERFTGHMGMFSLNHLQVHLRNSMLRQRGGLRVEPCVVSEDAEFLGQIPAAFSSLYSVVPQARVRELLETEDDRYRAVLSDRKGCANGGALVQQVLAYLELHYPDRLRYVDETFAGRVVVGDGSVVVHARGHSVTASQVVLCTNGFVDHVIEDGAGELISLHSDQHVTPTIGYMAAFVEEQPRTPSAMSFIRNTEVGGDTPYVYITRRTYDRSDGTVTLTCMGGPEHPIDGATYDRTAPFPGTLLTHMDERIRPFAQPARPPGRPYDFQWHGPMGYTAGMVRVIGAHPRHPALLYNLGCNGVGFLPSMYGGQRVARILAGGQLPPSIFDPR